MLWCTVLRGNVFCVVVYSTVLKGKVFCVVVYSIERKCVLCCGVQYTEYSIERKSLLCVVYSIDRIFLFSSVQYSVLCRNNFFCDVKNRKGFLVILCRVL